MSTSETRINGLDARGSIFLQTIPAVWRNFEDWPVPAASTVPANRQERFKRLCKAARLFLLKQPMSDVLEAAGVGDRQFFDLMRVALRTRIDGSSIEGGRAFIRCKVQPKRQRRKAQAAFDAESAGYSGLFEQLLRDKPEIHEALCEYLDGKRRANRMTPALLHHEFLRIVRAAKVREDEYPLNTDSRAKKALWNWHQTVFVPLRIVRHIRREHGKDAATAAGFSEGDGSEQPQHPLYAGWVIDEVKIDARMTVELPSLKFGTERVFIGQCQGILVRSMAPASANLAFHLCLQKQASADDIALVLRDAIAGRDVLMASDGQWALHEGAGFPSKLITALQYALPQHIYLDNSLAHLADGVQYLLTQMGGGKVHLGKPAMPKSRPEIEAAFSRYLNDFIHQLPGTTGTGPKDPLRQAAEVPAERSVVWSWIKEASIAYFANENVTGSAASGYSDAVTRLCSFAEQGALQLNYVPEGRRKVHYFSAPREVRVNCNLAKGRLPYVYTMYRRYSCKWLKSRPDLRGKRYFVRIDPDDLSHVLLVDDNDAEVCVLRAEGQWGLFTHNQQILRIYARHKHRALNGRRAYEAPIHLVLQRMTEAAPNDADTAQDLAYVIDYFRRCVSPEAQAKLGMSNIPALPSPDEATQIVVPSSRPAMVPVSPPRASAPKPTARPSGRRSPTTSFAIPRRFA